ncbi:MAG: hypothetical protein AAGF20_02850 [Pseudomonadota bacterium]
MTPSDGRLIASQEQRDQLIKDRENDPERLDLNHPAPSWADNSSDDKERRRIAAREQRIRYLTNRLEGAARKAERDFDQSIF